MRIKGFAFVLVLQMILSMISLTALVWTAGGSESDGPRPMTWCSLFEGDGTSSPSSEGWTITTGSGSITGGVSDGATVGIVNHPGGGGTWMNRYVDFEQPFTISTRGRYDPTTTYTSYVYLMAVFTGNHSLVASLYPTELMVGLNPVVRITTIQGDWYNVTFDVKAPLDVDAYVNGAFVGNGEMWPADRITWDQPANKPNIASLVTGMGESAKGMVDYIRTTMCPLTEVPPKTPDRTPPRIRNVMLDNGIWPPENHLTVMRGTYSKVWLNATVDDTMTGNSRIWSANYSLMPRTWPGTPMAAADGAFDSPIEDVTAQVDISGLAVGNYTYCVYARDYQGPKNLTGACGILTISRDLYLEITCNVPDCPEGASDLHIEAVTSDPSLVWFEWDFNNDSIWDTPLTTQRSYDLASRGDNFVGRVCVGAWDGVGEELFACSYYEVTNVPPTVDAGPDKTGNTGASIDFLFNFTDPGYDEPIRHTWENFTATVDWGDGPPQAWAVNEVPGSSGVLTTGNVTADHAYAASGAFDVNVIVCDDDGGCGSDVARVTVGAQNAAMDPLPLSPIGGAWIGNETATFSWQFRDPEGDSQSGFRLQMDGDPLFPSPDVDTGAQSGSQGSMGIAPALPDGLWYWRVRTADEHGLWGAYSQPASFNIDATGPVTLISSASLEKGYAVTVSAEDDGIGVSAIFVSVDGGEWREYDGTIVLDGFGDHVVRAFAVDLLSNEGAEVEARYSVTNLKPLVAGAIGVVVLIIGLALMFVDRKRKKTWGIAVAGVGIAELIMAILSWMTGTLGIPPWIGVSLVVDIVMIVVAVVLCSLRWRSLQATKSPTAEQQVTPPPLP